MEAAIHELEQRRWQAMIDADLQVLDELLHQDLRYIHSTAAVDSKESYLAAIERGTFDYRAVDTSEVEIRTFDNIALVNGTAEITVVAREREFLLRSRYTCVWLNTIEGWKFLTWQNTPIVD